MQKLFTELTPEERLIWLAERRTRRAFRKSSAKRAKPPRRTIAALAKAWGVTPTKLEETLLTFVKQSGKV